MIGGVECKIHFYVMSLPHSEAVFVKGYPAETTEAFCDGHVSGFAFFGGIPQSILYDNTKVAVVHILGDGRRVRTRRFTELQSHYLFDDKFGRPARGNDSFDDLNAHLAQRCLERQGGKLRGHNQTIGECLVSDLDALMRLQAGKPALRSAPPEKAVLSPETNTRR